MTKPWVIEKKKGGEVFIKTEAGETLLRVYGQGDAKMALAEAVSNVPVLVEILSRKASQWKIVGIEYANTKN